MTTAQSAATETRFKDIPGLSDKLLQNLPFEFCTEVSIECGQI